MVKLGSGSFRKVENWHLSRLACLIIAENADGKEHQGLVPVPLEIGPVPTDWFYTVQTLEGDINRKLDDMYKEEPDKFYKEKRPLS